MSYYSHSTLNITELLNITRRNHANFNGNTTLIHRSKKDGGCRFCQNALRSQIALLKANYRLLKNRQRQFNNFTLVLKFQSITFASCHLFPGILTRYLFCYGEFPPQQHPNFPGGSKTRGEGKYNMTEIKVVGLKRTWRARGRDRYT